VFRIFFEYFPKVFNGTADTVSTADNSISIEVGHDDNFQLSVYYPARCNESVESKFSFFYFD
jgi:hypothetical protein